MRLNFSFPYLNTLIRVFKSVRVLLPFYVVFYMEKANQASNVIALDYFVGFLYNVKKEMLMNMPSIK